MKVSAKGIVEIAEHEGVVPAPYRDSVGVWTYGVGHTAAAGGLDPQEMNSSMPTGEALEFAIKRALLLFEADLEKYERRVLNALPGVPLKQHEFDALVSWDFNTGGATWRGKNGQKAALIRQLLAGDYSGDGFMGWLRPVEIRKRRTAELALFRTGDYDANGTTVPVWGTDGKGRLRGIVRTLDGRELLAYMGKPSVPYAPQSPSAANPWAQLIAWLAKIFGGKA